MDSITHIALGACIGELIAKKSLGKKALIIGAATQSLPDIDFVASFWLSPANDLLAHRGFTHSILFAALLAYPLALILARTRWLPSTPIKNLTLFIGLEMMVHLFIDSFNAYGTAWFEPFSHYRVSFNALFVADPFFSIAICLAAIIIFTAPLTYNHRRRWAAASIFISILYLTYAVYNKIAIHSTIEQSLQAQSIKYKRYFSTPTPGNVWLWYIVVEDKQGYHVGYRSVFDRQQMISFEFFPRNDSLLASVSDHENLQRLLRFSEGYYIVSEYDKRLVFNDLRFGQMLGWEEPRAPFVFYYFLDHPDDNELLIQRGRFALWTKESVYYFFNRIMGI